VAAQGMWRCKLARRKLRALRAEAREAGKLMQDKRFLETKVAELTSTLELVQNQRNDLRQQFRVRAVHSNCCCCHDSPFHQFQAGREPCLNGNCCYLRRHVKGQYRCMIATLE
jgi:transposase InsO family protein